MSLLESLKNKKLCLKSTQTVITRADGRKFVVKELGGDAAVQLDERSFGFVVDYKPDDVPARINEHLYLGSQDCCDGSVLSKYNIGRVLSVGVEAPERIAGIEYKYVQCLDLPETDIVKILTDDCADFIREASGAGTRVLVHCNAGVSRSSAIVIGYLMLEDKLDYEAAYDIVKGARSSIKPNAGFEKQLRGLKT